ncbi:glycoside hydrolase family 3 C-terminal domain-containing protein (plasmid) [Deinococcus taeanensis]|uniref:glycoside hydrolase family 3 protein n=1 Tax=Deinococcus taeanensis TaxID=2737050 RepID=UPI001CDD8457|nr:glycoside hydrolase family 3 N-terminal domain-containing protein [Deinococcus taeanensis]UBV44214.1 glycoside hydrolase family 3 C-terminal domain-containing protein [Deinococcus taeanensis]
MTTSPLTSDQQQFTEQLLAQMTLAEKIGQMTQPEKNSVKPGDVARLALGSVLSGGGGNPEPNTPAGWRAMVTQFIAEAQQSRLRIPLIYGVDAVHGHNNVVGATIFPHNIGLGATRDAELVRRIGRATALEVAATNVRWNFAPAVSVPQDIRWGRTYEGYSQDPRLVSDLAVALIRGFEGDGWTAPTAVLPSVKHFVADAATTWGSSTRAQSFDRTLSNATMTQDFRELLERGAWQIDQGNAEIDEATLRAVHLPPYRAAIEAGALNVMASYSAWQGLKVHAHRYLLTDVLKGELGFQGFVVSDWEALDQLHPGDYDRCVVDAINAGIDMVMVPFDYERFIGSLTRAVDSSAVPLARIDDAVRRILTAKVALGLFEQPHTDERLLALVGCGAHRDLAREAVQKSLVLLKNAGALPLDPHGPEVLVAGADADDLGAQCGGWTISWMGGRGPTTPGTTILEGLRAAAGPDRVHYSPDGHVTRDYRAGVVVLAEEPYAEGMGDRADLTLSAEQAALVARVRARCEQLTVVLLSGRPLVITEHLPAWDALVAAWLPGTEGQGVADVLFGRVPFSGRLPFDWPRTADHLRRGDGPAPLFALGEAAAALEPVMGD